MNWRPPAFVVIPPMLALHLPRILGVLSPDTDLADSSLISYHDISEVVSLLSLSNERCAVGSTRASGGMAWRGGRAGL